MIEVAVAHAFHGAESRESDQTLLSKQIGYCAVSPLPPPGTPTVLHHVLAAMLSSFREAFLRVRSPEAADSQQF